jgi:hypothetical protein
MVKTSWVIAGCTALCIAVSGWHAQRNAALTSHDPWSAALGGIAKAERPSWSDVCGGVVYVDCDVLGDGLPALSRDHASPAAYVGQFKRQQPCGNGEVYLRVTHFLGDDVEGEFPVFKGTFVDGLPTSVGYVCSPVSGAQLARLRFSSGGDVIEFIE